MPRTLATHLVGVTVDKPHPRGYRPDLPLKGAINGESADWCRGHAAGFMEGYEEGKDEGHEDGYKEGETAGKEEAREELRDAGPARDLRDFGLHKTVTQLEIMRLSAARRGLRLIVLPLGVRQEFTRDAARGSRRARDPLKFIRSADEIDDERTIYLTNYETVRDGKLDPTSSTPRRSTRRACCARSARRPIRRS
jgi:hypothetical protein